MHKRFLFVFAPLIFFACSNESTDEALSKPPYKPLTDSIRQDPDNAGLYYRRSRLLYVNNLLDYAEADIRKAWELEPKEEYAIGVVTILNQKKSKEAIPFLENALKKLPNSLFLMVELSNAYHETGAYDKALQLCDRIIGQYPNNIDAYLTKARILYASNREQEAVSTLEQAYPYAPGDVEMVHQLGFYYAESKNPKTLALSDSLIKADVEGSHAEPYFFKGVYYSNTGNFSEAIRQFDEAIRADHNFITAYINKGIIYYDQKNYQKAMDVFELALNVSADEADIYYWIAKTQEAQGQVADAKANYLRAYNLDKTMSEAKEAADRL